uniref:WD40 repeat n=1 Tax=Candidatus Kentrum eta TaxID=2126337 RepID=A0A450UUW3_9GAMM|nr:MAG: hypothetical protein BECKH772A_GA0070896_1000618 [Candidatus Kentron sp. H]VFJ89972.1 MAG: hypothetical protein BECKH772B_GA0070898_1000718 [Candidatus Kentron sp. H]VFJ96348.1 MAG: hypothetical protein BECKH772C_GA0070978_1000618 [Candidatus Kentron sp. H]
MSGENSPFLRAVVALLWFSLGVLLIPLALWLTHMSTEGHSAPIAEIAFSPESGEIVTIGADGQLFWDAATGRESKRRKKTIPSTENPILSADRMLAGPYGRRLVLADGRQMEIWNRAEGGAFCAMDFEDPPKDCLEFEQPPKALALSSNGAEVYAMEESRLLSWETETGRPARAPLRWAAPVLKWYVSPELQRGASFSDGRVTVYSLAQSVAGRVDPAPIASFQATAFAATRDKLLISDAQGTTIRDFNTGKIRKTIGHAKSALAIGVSPDERHAVILEEDGELSIIDLDTEEQVIEALLSDTDTYTDTYTEHAIKEGLSDMEFKKEGLTSLRLSNKTPSQPFRLTLNYRTGVQTWKLADRIHYIRPDLPEKKHAEFVAKIEPSADILAHDVTRNVYFQLEPVDREWFRIQRFDAVTREPTGKIALSKRLRKQLRQEQLRQEQLRQERRRQEESYLATLDTPLQEITTFPLRLVSAISPDGARLAIAVQDTIHILDALTGAEIGRRRVPMPPDASILSLMFTSDGQIAAMDSRSAVSLYNKQAERMVLLGEFRVEPGTLLALSADGERVLVRRGNSLWIADAKNGDRLSRLKTEDGIGEMQEARFSQDGNRVIAWIDDGFRLWDAETGKEIKETRGLDSIDTTVVSRWALSPDGSKIAIVYDGNSTVLIRDVETGKGLRKIKPPHADDGIRALEYTPDGGSLLLISGARWQLWDAVSGELRLESAIPFWHPEIWGWPVLFWWLFLVFVVFFIPTLSWFNRSKKIGFSTNPYLELLDRPGIERYLPPGILSEPSPGQAARG